MTTGTYVEVIEAVQRDALDSMGTLFEQVGDDSSGRLSSMKPRLSSNARESGPRTASDLGGAKGTRTPDPHTARVKTTVLGRSAVSTEWRSVQLDAQFSC